MAGEESIAWDLGNAPKQSITEVLQNPRGPTLELPELSSFDLSGATSLSLTSPAPITKLPEPLNINHFESYLRRVGPLHAEFAAEKRRLDSAAAASFPTQPDPAAADSLDAIPSIYFEPSFSVARNHQLAALQHATTAETPSPVLSRTEVKELRDTLATYRTALEKAMRHRLAAQAPAIEASLAQVRALRDELHSTAAALREARTTAARLVPAVADGLRAARAVSSVQANVRALRGAVASVQLVLHTPGDVAALLHTGAFAAAIQAVAAAKAALTHRDLSPVLALAPARGRLAQAVEAIDAALREEFRGALRAPPGPAQEDTLREVVDFVAIMGRLPLLRGFFLKEIKVDLANELKTVESLPAASKAVKASAGRALMLITIIHANEEDSAGLEEGSVQKAKPYLREVHDDLEEMLASAVGRFLTSLAVSSEATGIRSSFVVITETSTLTEATCFDEFKAALKFGEEVRSLEEIASELEAMFSSEKRSSALRAKISERQIAFLSAFHKAHVEALTQTVRADKWQELRVPQGALRLLGAVVSNSANGVDEDVQQNGVRAHSESKSAGHVDSMDGAVVIGSDVFKTVASGVRYLRSMCAYTLLAEKSSNLAPEIARRATELCRLFNSLIGKAILGAAALQWSGLRSITARHLSLASRTVAMAAALADHVNRPLEKALSGAQVGVILPLIQKSEKDLRDHHAQLLAKILAIMMDRLEAHEAVLKSLPWDKAQEMQRFDVPSAYIATLVKEATVLHRILWSILPRTEVCDIFQRVCAAYGTHLTEAYGSLDGGKEWVRSRVAEDVSCLHDRLQVMDVFKANLAAFKPVAKLYARFAKEYKKSEKGGAADGKSASPNRTFILRRETEPPKQQEPESAAVSIADAAPKGEESKRRDDIDERHSDASSFMNSREPSTDVSLEDQATVVGGHSTMDHVDKKADAENSKHGASAHSERTEGKSRHEQQIESKESAEEKRKDEQDVLCSPEDAKNATHYGAAENSKGVKHEESTTGTSDSVQSVDDSLNAKAPNGPVPGKANGKSRDNPAGETPGAPDDEMVSIENGISRDGEPVEVPEGDLIGIEGVSGDIKDR